MKKLVCNLLLLLPCAVFAQYKGTASVSQGLATTVVNNLYTCSGGRIAGIGAIKATDNTTWTVPALVNYTNTSFPFASDLNNVCNGKNYANATAALAALNGSDIVTVDAGGEVITAFVFADNYFEMYINGVPVGKDNVPYTQFNSNIVRFRAKRPFTIAMLLVDWEEHLGLGAELNGGFAYHDGDGGMVAVFKDAAGNTIAVTGSDWKAQTFYTAPVTDLSCPAEDGSLRLSNNCSTADSRDGSNYYALHWSRPANWETRDFNDASWPQATAYSNTVIGVDNKPAYTNFTDIFDNQAKDAQFIWSTNVILDNEVIVRYKVNAGAGIMDKKTGKAGLQLYPNPAGSSFGLRASESMRLGEIRKITLYDAMGRPQLETAGYDGEIPVRDLPAGMYYVKVIFPGEEIILKMFVK